MGTLWRGGATSEAPRNKSNKTETQHATTEPRIPSRVTTASPQTKRDGEEFKQQAVAHWRKPGKPGTQIAAAIFPLTKTALGFIVAAFDESHTDDQSSDARHRRGRLCTARIRHA